MSHPSGPISLPSSSSSSGAAPTPSSFFSSSSSSTAPTSLVAVWVLLGALGSLLLLWALCYLALRQWDRRSPSRSDDEADSRLRLWRLPLRGLRRHHRAQLQQQQPPSHPLQIMIRTDTTERWEERGAQSDGHEQHDVPLGLSSSATAKPSSAAPQPSSGIELKPTSSPSQSGSQARSASAIRWLIPPPAASQPPPSLGQAVLLGEAQEVQAPRVAPAESSSATMQREVSWYEAMQDVTLADPTMWTIPSRRAREEDDGDEGVTNATHEHGREGSNSVANH